MKFLRWRQGKDEELDAEIQPHLDEAIRARMERGESAEQARLNARREFGNVGLVKEVTREMWGWASLERFMQDLRFGSRMLRKQPGLSLSVILILSLGIGVSTGVFAWFNAEFLRARVDKDYASFVKVHAAYTRDTTQAVIPGDATWNDYQAFRAGAQSLDKLAAYGEFAAPLGADDPAVTRALLVSENFFALYDPGPPLLGRLLQPADFTSPQPVVVLSERLWRSRFAADAQVISKIVTFNGQPVTVVGVAPNFAGMVNGARAWFPYSLESYLKLGDNRQRPGEAAWLEVEGQLRPGFTRAQAAIELRLLAAQQDRLHLFPGGRLTTVWVTDGSPIQEPYFGERLKTVAALLVGALTVFVLIVCVNVTTLLLTRAAARQQEIAVRVALGAGRWRLLRMLLTETLLLAAAAGLVSVYLAWQLPNLLLYWLINPWGEGGGTWYSLSPDWRVFGYLALVTLLAGVMAGLTPALQSLKVNLSEMLKGRQSLPSGGKGARLYGLLIGTQVALSLFLLAGAFLFIRTTQRAMNFAPGFATRQVLVGQVRAPAGAESRTWGAYHRTMTEQLAALPGVQSVAWASWSPLFAGSAQINVLARGQAVRRVAFNTVSASYFATLEIPIVSGRAPRADEPLCDQGRCPVVISERLAREFWPNEVPLGQTLQTPEGDSYEVIGVARDTASTRLGGVDDPLIYFPWNPNGNHPANAFVHFAGDEANVARAMLTAYRTHAPDLPVEAATLHAIREHMMTSIGKLTQLVVFLCALAVSLALLGVHGVVAFAVSRRTKELGIRLALGAQRQDIYRAVLANSGRPVALGLFIGLALSLAVFSALAPVVRNAPFAVNVQEPIIYVAAALALVIASLTAMFGPAQRAAKIDPIAVLRQD